jgi:ferric-dicitrate binding protein FerR (iron transport regulator)
VQAAGDVDIKSTGGNVNVTSDSGDVSVACATGTASISAKNISLSGTTQLDLEGALVKIALRTFLLHTHTGGTILGLTGPVV